MVQPLLQQTDDNARLVLPQDFASCLVAVERHGDEIRIRKMGLVERKRYSFKEMMAGVTQENIHAEVNSGPAVGEEAL